MEFDPAEKAVLDDIGRELRAQGWSTDVTVERLLRDWKEVAASVAGYESTVDDYTNDLAGRDGLELVLARCPEPLRGKVRALVEAADDEFRNGTVEDVAGALARFFRVGAGWWWGRKPSGGALAEFLARYS